MTVNDATRKKAFQLRKVGWSYKKITDTLRIPKSTLSGWLGDIEWSKKVRTVLAEKAKINNRIRILRLDKTRGEELKKVYRVAEEEAEKEFQDLQLYPLFIAGLMIFWGEGDKLSRNLVRISNTDPLMIRVFVRFLIKVCGVEISHIRASILLYPDLNEKISRSFWIEQSGLSQDNFNKSTVIKGRHKTRRLQYGVCTVGVSSSYLKTKVRVWLVLLSKELLKKNYAGIS